MRIEVDSEHIRRNAQAIVQVCAAHGVDVAGVTKACCGHPDVARAMLAGGVTTLADSRLKNIRRLREAGVEHPIMLLRLPALSQVDEVVALTQLSLNSELETVRALSAAAQARGIRHRVILMVETGDRREGVMPEQVIQVARQILPLPGVELAGLAGNVGCIGGVLPTRENTQLLVDVVEEVERRLGVRMPIVSGGHSANLALLLRGELPARVNHLRIGEGILLGVETASNWPLPCPHQNTFRVFAQVIEVTTKPSMPEGPISIDAFGRIPHWEDHGPRRRAVLAIGEQDLRIDGLRPSRHGVTIVGASSDHMVVDVTDAEPPVRLGEELEFDPVYAAVATAMASQDVDQVVKPISHVSVASSR
jgi:predicted amino acid racemase